jgi:ribulose-5-phosphate 4-epimerase/fuculose-1-phosphate aldolase
MDTNVISQREALADAFQLAARFGWTDLIYTHMSVRSCDDHNIFYINEYGLLFEEITPSNLIATNVHIKPSNDGRRVVNPAGWSVHSAIYREKPEVNSIIHLHTNSSMAVSCTKEGLLPISQPACLIYKHIVYHEYSGIACEDIDNITFAKELDQPICILRNHGTLTTGATVAEAFCYMYLLEKALQVQQLTLAMGRDIAEIPDAIKEFTSSQFRKQGLNSYELEWAALLRSLPERFSKSIMPTLQQNKSPLSMAS